ncbi:MAG: hypothetical protein ACK5OX_03355 [Desertimonas sp.]
MSGWRASLRERRPGNWELIVQLPRDPETGLRKRLSRTRHGTKREAQRALAALVAQVSAGKVTSTAKTLGELLDQWLEHVDQQLSPTTAREYRRLVATTIDPDLGSLRLGRVTTKRVDDYSAQLTAERDPEYGALPRHLTSTEAPARGRSPRWPAAPSRYIPTRSPGRSPASATGLRSVASDFTICATCTPPSSSPRRFGPHRQRAPRSRQRRHHPERVRPLPGSQRSRSRRRHR